MNPPSLAETVPYITNSLACKTPKLPRSGASGFPTLPLYVLLPDLHIRLSRETMFLSDLLGKVPVRGEPETEAAAKIC